MERLRVWIERSHVMGEDTFSKAPAFRPPPLRTSNTYDDDEAFTRVALNLLSRHEALGLSPSDTINSTIGSPQDRASFFEGLNLRKSRLTSLSPSTVSLVQDVDMKFGHELRKLVDVEHVTLRRQNHSPAHPQYGMISSNNSCGSGNRPQEAVSAKKRKNRRFFPEGEASVFFRSRRVQNIDWTLVEMTQQVQSLQLDGNDVMASTGNHRGEYEPPSLH